MNYDDQHRKHLMAYLQQIERLFYQLVGTAVFIALKTDYKEIIASTLFSFATIKRGKSFEKELANFSNQLDQIIKQVITKEWNFANIKQDKLLREGLTKYKNLEVLETFKTRKIKDFTVSDRVWDIAKKAQTELELALSVSLEEGKSAVQLSREIRNLLNNPTALFRRVRDKYGNLILSKNAQNYHPGQGVYRSAYKNALRLASNEINVAYKSSDWLRIQQNPDVVGFEVRLSPQHKVYDMCDELKGKYPKTFHFHGWHVGCKCHIVSILKTPDELIKELKADKELPPESSSNYVDDVPKEYKQWITDNKDRFKNWKTKPYFIEVNKETIITNDVSQLMKKAIKSEPEIKSMLNKLTKELGGYATPINYKSRESILRKVTDELNGNVEDIKDSIRATIIVPEEKMKNILLYLEKSSIFARVKNQTPEQFLGYSGIITNIHTKQNIFAEIQFNTEKMIYAKESTPNAIRILGQKRYNDIRKETGIEGGLGHKFYEEIRALKAKANNTPDVLKRIEELEKQSFNYYNKFR